MAQSEETRPGRPLHYRGVVLFGKPGAGKGTQGRMLGAAPGLIHVDVGALLRSPLETDVDGGESVRDALESGALLPDDLVMDLFARHLGASREAGAYEPARDLLVLDGIPRTIGQAKQLDRLLDVSLVIHLWCHDDEVLLGRVRGIERETMQRQLAAYARETVPVLRHYDPAKRSEVDALQHPLVVHDRILHLLFRFAIDVGIGR